MGEAWPIMVETVFSPENEVVVAGAGTGKTYALVRAYLITLLGLEGSQGPVPPRRLLAITFTEKAAAEMRTRVLAALSHLIRGETDKTPLQGWPQDALNERMPDAHTLEILRRDLAFAPITTFHSFCAQILREYALALGIDPTFGILEPAEAEALMKEAAEAVLLDALANGDAEVAELAARFQLRRMGRGQGLADHLVAVHDALAERGLGPEDLRAAHGDEHPVQKSVQHPAISARDDEILKQAFEDARQALLALADGGDKKPTAKALERVADLQPLVAALKQATSEQDEEWEVRVAHAFTALRRKAGGNWGNRELRGRLMAAIAILGQRLVDLVTVPQARVVCRMVVKLHERAQLDKAVRNAWSFGDLLLHARRLLAEHASIRARIKARFVRVFVDEFQDTSPIQEDIVAWLSEVPHEGTRIEPKSRAMAQVPLEKGRLFVVGDPKQSIYGFRGADVALFDETRRVVVEGNAATGSTGRVTPLQTCRRCRPGIIEVVNRVAAMTLPHEGSADGIPFSDSDRLVPHRAGGPRAGARWQVVVDEARDRPVALAIGIANAIDDCLQKEIPVGEVGEERALRPGDIAILVRRIAAAGPMLRALLRLGIPAQVVGGEGFFGRQEIMDLVAGMQLVADPSDELATLTVLRSPLVAFPDAELLPLLEGLPDWKGGLSWKEVVHGANHGPVNESARQRVNGLDALLVDLRKALPTTRLVRILDGLIDETPMAQALGLSPDAVAQWANVHQLRRLCEGKPGEGIERIARLWDALDDPPRLGLADSLPTDLDAVRLMTIHQAKGLEFPMVVLADTEARPRVESSDVLFDPDVGLAVSHRGRPIAACAPDKKAERQIAPTALDRVRMRRQERDEAEMARLLYVALTRARDRLFFVESIQAKARRGGKHLKALLHRAVALEPEAFDQLLPGDALLPAPRPPRALPHEEKALLPRESLPLIQAGRRRMAVSALATDGDLPVSTRVHSERLAAWVSESKGSDPLLHRERAKQWGIEAHALFAHLAEMESPDLWSSPDRNDLAEAFFRARGTRQPDGSFPSEEIVRRVFETLNNQLAPHWPEVHGVSTELPVRLELGHGHLVEGVADLVVWRNEGPLVVEVKSTDGEYRAKSSWVQAALYAAALAHTRPGKGQGENWPSLAYAVWLLGDPHPQESVELDAGLVQALTAAAVAAANAVASVDSQPGRG
jgi:ATP-dependent helicase/nuclease subunit A